MSGVDIAPKCDAKPIEAARGSMEKAVSMRAFAQLELAMYLDAWRTSYVEQTRQGL